MSNAESGSRRDSDSKRMTRRELLRSSTASALPLLVGGGLTGQKVLGPEAMPRVREPGTVSYTGVVMSGATKDRVLSPVAAYRCPFCGARRLPPDIEDPSDLPRRLCPLCAADVPDEVDDRRRWLTFRHYGLDPACVSRKPAGLETGEVLLPTKVADIEIEVFDRIRVTGTQREIGAILPEMYSREDALFKLEPPVGKVGKKLWHRPVQVLAQSVTHLGTKNPP
jgi:hypothetical protein